MNPNVNCAFTLLGRLKNRGITHCVISPGSRSTPLAYVAHQLFETVSVIDERDAGFLALGLSCSSGNAAVVITTSGSAPSHLFPAICEAYNSNFGMIVISADRPHELRSAGAAQTIDQVHLFGTHVRFSLDTKLASEVSDDAYWNEIADEVYAATSSTSITRGPAHINIGFDEHLTPDGDESFLAQDLSTLLSFDSLSDSSNVVIEKLKNDMRSVKAGVITLGRNNYVDPLLISELSKKLAWPLLCDVTSNARFVDNAISNYDAMARVSSFEGLLPEMVLQFGEPLGSKIWNQKVTKAESNIVALKRFEDGRDPHLNQAYEIIEANLNLLIKDLLENVEKLNSDFKKRFNTLSNFCTKKIEAMFPEYSTKEPAIFEHIGYTLAHREHNINVLIGNSMPIRYAEWFWPLSAENVKYFSNRGTNGIDGSLSCATGIALASKNQTVAIVGDITFAHDVGFLSHANELALKNNVNIIFVVINNNGGAIFSHLDQSKNEAMTDSYDDIMRTPLDVNFKNVAKAFNCRDWSSLKVFKSVVMKNTPGVDVICINTDHFSGRDMMAQLVDELNKP